MKHYRGSERIEYHIGKNNPTNIDLMLHDARVLAVSVSGRESGINDVEIELDPRGAMATAHRLILGSCSFLRMDNLNNCWWIGEEVQGSSEGFVIDAECVSEQDDTRSLKIVCQRIILE